MIRYFVPMTNGGDGNDSTCTGRPAGCVADLREAVGHFAAAVDVITGGWDLLDDDARHELYVELETARRRLAIVHTEYLSATANGRVVKQTPAAMRKLVENAHVSRAEARRRLAAAHRLQRAEVQDRPPKHDLPAVRQRVEEGVAGADAVELIHKALDELPERGNELVHVADPHFADLLDKVQVDDLRHLGPMHRALWGLDDPYSDEDRQRRRSVRLSQPDGDNMSRISGHVTPEMGAILRRLWADFAGPGALLPKGADDDRTADQRRHDAVEAGIATGFGSEGSDEGTDEGPSEGPEEGAGEEPDEGSGEGPDTGPDEGPVDGSPPASPAPPSPSPAPNIRPAKRLRPKRGTTSIVVTMHISELAKMTGTALTDVSTTMSIGEAVRGADARDVFLSVMDFRGRNLWFGRSRRAGSPNQYLALCAEEGMSTAPGSSSPPAYCDIHHIDKWDTGGPTDVDAMTLADYVMHGRVDDDRADENRWWTTRAGPPEHREPGRGAARGPEDGARHGPENPKVRWIPPKSMDPDRAPRENHHPLGWLAPGRRIRRFFSRGAGSQGEPDEGVDGVPQA